MKLFRLFAGAAAVSLLMGAAGCGGGSATTAGQTFHVPPPRREFQITLDGAASPATVGILMAKERGYFERAGLEVWVRTPVGPTLPIPYVVAGEIDVSISHLPQVAMATEKGAPVTAIASLVPQPTAAMIWLAGSGIGSVADLAGKTIAIPGLPFQRGFLEAILRRAGLGAADVEIKVVGYGLVQALVKGEADAIFGGASNVEGVELRARGLKPVIATVQQLGLPDYEELALIARPDRLGEDPRSIREFIAAMQRGTAAAIENPAAAARVIGGANGKPAKLMQLELEATLPLLSTTGRMDPRKAEAIAGWMEEEGILGAAPPASALLTNAYLEPQP